MGTSGGGVVSVVYEPSGIFTDQYNELHDKLRKAVSALVEQEIKPFLEANKAPCADIRLINNEWRDIIDMEMDSLWLDCLGELRGVAS